MSSEQSQKQDHPSLVGGHAKYVEGAVASVLGYESGEKTKQEAIDQMKRASDQSDSAPTQSSVLGTIENKLGQVTGCEGMEKEGAQRIPKGVEETNGTG